MLYRDDKIEINGFAFEGSSIYAWCVHHNLGIYYMGVKYELMHPSKLTYSQLFEVFSGMNMQTVNALSPAEAIKERLLFVNKNKSYYFTRSSDSLADELDLEGERLRKIKRGDLHPVFIELFSNWENETF